jgi:hypothetical protein
VFAAPVDGGGMDFYVDDVGKIVCYSLGRNCGDDF